MRRTATTCRSSTRESRRCLTIEGADSTNDEIHSARDTLDRIDLALAEEILKMNVAFVATALAAP